MTDLAHVPGGRRWLGEKERFMLLLIAPAASVLLLFQVVPILLGANASFRHWPLYDPSGEWLGLQHYLRVLSDPVFLTLVMPNTLLLMVSSVSRWPTCSTATSSASGWCRRSSCCR